MTRVRSPLVFPVWSIVLIACGSTNATEVERRSAAATDTPPAEAPPTPEPPPPPVGIDTISVDELRAHVTTLASDDFRGRETNRDGARLAADYLVERFREYGLSAMPGQQDFLVDYQLAELGFDTKTSTGTVTVGDTQRALAPEVDFAPFYFSKPGTWDGEVVFAGYGISSKKLGRDDYEGLDVRNKIVLVLRYWPDEKAENNPLARSGAGTFEAKALNAERHGAVGMLLVTGPRYHAEADDLRQFSDLSLPLTDEQLAKRAARGSKKGKAFLAAHISQQLAAELVAPLGVSLVDVQTALDTGAAMARDYAITGVRASLTLTELTEPAPVTGHNVIGFLEGSDPALRDEWIVIGAHYDHLGAFDGAGDTVYNGADDNASGTSGMLELAQAFASLPERPRRSILFAGFSGEEKGLLGSRAMFDQDIIAPEQVAFMLNLDMIGRNPDDAVEVVGDGFASGLSEIVTAANASVGLAVELGGSDYSANSDHHPFFLHHVPVLFFFSGLHDDYHQLSDHADKIAYDHMARITRVSYGIVDRVAGADTRPAFIHQLPWLGIAVEMRDGQAVIARVEAESPAIELGFAAGDVVLAVGKTTTDSHASLGDAFDAIDPGEKASFRLSRDGEEVAIRVTRKKPGFLGVYPREVPAETRDALGLADGEGVLLESVTRGGPAAKAGLKDGDILVSIDGAPISDRNLTQRLARLGAGTKVTIVYARDGARDTIDMKLGTRPSRR